MNWHVVSIDSDVDSDSTVGNGEHNIWNPLLDVVVDYRKGTGAAEIPAGRRGRTRGAHESFCPGCDVACMTCCDDGGIEKEFEIGKYSA